MMVLLFEPFVYVQYLCCPLLTVFGKKDFRYSREEPERGKRELPRGRVVETIFKPLAGMFSEL